MSTYQIFYEASIEDLKSWYADAVNPLLIFPEKHTLYGNSLFDPDEFESMSLGQLLQDIRLLEPYREVGLVNPELIIAELLHQGLRHQNMDGVRELSATFSDFEGARAYSSKFVKDTMSEMKDWIEGDKGWR